MCLRPVTLINPKKNLSLYGGVSYNIEVPCGSCVECEKQKQSEWYFRAYYESKYTFDCGGYVYFDTLTYRNEDLPHVSDYSDKLKGPLVDCSCFNVEHYRLFFVNLRRQLEYHGFDVKNNLKYFLTSEYGVDDRYTHRPHYHVLFYIKDGSIDPLVFSDYVAKCWKYGRTDGVKYKGAKYVLDHVFGKKYNCDEVHMQTVCNYVAKYVTKDSKFQDKIKSRINVVKERLGIDERNMTICEENMLKKLERNMNQFHRQSHCFGEAFYLYNDLEKVLETGMISMPDKNNIVKHIPLPGYYSRKLFYDLVKDFDGHLQWKINDLGVKFKLRHKLKAIDTMVDKFSNWRLNMSLRNMTIRENYVDEDGHRWTKEESEEWYVDHIDKFDKLLGNRDIKEFVIYLLCYKGRIKSSEEVSREENGIYRVDPLVDFVQREFALEQDFGCKQVYNYAHKCYRRFFGCRFVSEIDLGDSKSGIVPFYVSKYNEFVDKVQGGLSMVNKPSYLQFNKDHYRFNGYTDKFSSCDNFSKKYVITDKSDPSFEYFDEMYWLWCDSLRYINVEKQKFHDWKKDYKDRMKRIGYFKRSL